MTLTIDQIYLLRGGHIVQYLGPKHHGWGLDNVLRQITLEDARMLRVRYVQLLVRRLVVEAEWIKEVMGLVGVSLPTLPPSLRP